MRARKASKAPKLSREVIAAEALKNATEQNSFMNYPAIIEGFVAKGIAMQDIEPRVNVFTYNAWKAQNRQVRKGETGVKIVTFVKAKGKASESSDGEEQGYKFPRTISVFHISQTDPIEP